MQQDVTETTESAWNANAVWSSRKKLMVATALLRKLFLHLLGQCGSIQKRMKIKLLDCSSYWLCVDRIESF
jgi:hypothetical protein